MHVHYVYAHTYIYTDTYKMFLKYFNHMDVSDYNNVYPLMKICIDTQTKGNT